jgi:hypothetical protein
LTEWNKCSAVEICCCRLSGSIASMIQAKGDTLPLCASFITLKIPHRQSLESLVSPHSILIKYVLRYRKRANARINTGRARTAVTDKFSARGWLIARPVE